MSGQNKLHRLQPWIFVFLFILLLATAIPLVKLIKRPAGQSAKQPAADGEQEVINGEKQKPTLKDIIQTSRTWGPAFTSWYGQMATDFVLTDLNGKEHKLSDYRGKDVLIVFWATWCGPCLREIPHLMVLRNTIGEDKLAMLAISNENPALLRRFTKRNKINYTVLSSGGGVLPAPFSMVDSIPTSFFIDPNGKIKLAASGLISLGTVKAILQAE